MPRLSTLHRSTSIQDASIASLSVLDFLAPALLESTPRLRSCPGVNSARNQSSLVFSKSVEPLFYTALSRASLCNAHRKPQGTRPVSSVPSSSAEESQGEAVPITKLDKRLEVKKQNARSGLVKRDGIPYEPIAEVNSSHNQSRHHLHGYNAFGQISNLDRGKEDTPTGSVGQGKPRYQSSTAQDYDMIDPNPMRNAPKKLQLGTEASEVDAVNKNLLGKDSILDALHGFLDLQNKGKLSENSSRDPRTYEESRSTEFSQSESKPDHHRPLVRQRHARRRAYTIRPTTYVFEPTGQPNERAFRDPSWKHPPHMSSNSRRSYHTESTRSKPRPRRFADGSQLLRNIRDNIPTSEETSSRSPEYSRFSPSQERTPTTSNAHVHSRISSDRPSPLPDNRLGTDTETTPDLKHQLKLLSSIRELEEKLNKARNDLGKSFSSNVRSPEIQATEPQIKEVQQVVLTKEDYMNLVDLYYHSHNSRFSPESTDSSPTPLFLNDYSFIISSDFSSGDPAKNTVNEDEHYESPLTRIEEMLKKRQLREVATMQVFVDLLLDDLSSNRALYEAYKQLPNPGVSYLPKGIVRLFLQRMSTPWTVSEKSMLRYLSLIDDMQKAEIPITTGEWSSAVYLAGRAFSKVTDSEVAASFQIWQTMEQDAGVTASHVTFNILFDIAVRSGRFALGESVLKEMHSRDLRLNRLGRVSLMYYHGLKRDGDGVRKAYRDFVEAGEIVDTVVLNCVIASLMNAQEPQAAEQVYTRMKDMQLQLRKGVNTDGIETLYKRYPDPGTGTIDQEMASNHLGRILEKAPSLLKILPERHEHLQSLMPLSPDHVTFRSMVAYHATVSGDLDRLTVLLKEMTEIFHLPLQTITFQLLFKGFALHGPTGGPNSNWSSKRLELCWNACREAIKESNAVIATTKLESETMGETGLSMEDKADDSRNPTLPSITQVNAVPQHDVLPNFSPPLSRPPPRRLSSWAEFVLDLAAFPRERLKRLERFHATMFDAEDMNKPHEKSGIHTFTDPFFQSVAYTAPEPRLDVEEGEYVLPNPAGSGLLHSAESISQTGPKGHTSTRNAEDETFKAVTGSPHQVYANKTLICWLLRAYARNTKSRLKVEEIWGQVRKIYRPQSATDRESVVRVLRRCLRDCDREGSW